MDERTIAGGSDAFDEVLPDGLTTTLGESPHDQGAGKHKVLWIHAALLLALLFAGLIWLDNGHVAVPDEGVYLAQTSNLVDGSWKNDRPAPDVDTGGEFAPINDGGIYGEQVIPYSKHPLYPVVLVPFFSVGGITGTLVLSVLGTWAAAIAAAFIARRLNPGYGPWTLWIVGIGSPLLFDAYIAVGHSVAAACAGLAFLGLTRALDDRRPVHLLYALPAVSLMVALRSEGLALSAALAAAVGIMAIGWPPLRKIDWQGGIIAAATLASAGGTYLIEHAVVGSIGGPSSVQSTPADRLSSDSVDPLMGAWASLARPFSGTWANAGIYLPLASLGVLLAALAIKLMPKRTLMPMACLVGAAVSAGMLFLSPPGLVTGLLAAFPLLPAGILLLRSIDLRRPMIGRALGVGTLMTVLVVSSNYAVGGAAEWGGRFFHGLLPLLVPLAVLGLDNARELFGRRQAVGALICLSVVTLSFSTASIRSLYDRRQIVSALVESTIAVADAQGGGSTLVIVSKLRPDGSGRYFWDATDHDVLTSYTVAALPLLLARAEEAGLDRVVVATDIGGALFATAIGPVLDELGWEVLDSTPVPDGFASVLVIGSSSDG